MAWTILVAKGWITVEGDVLQLEHTFASNNDEINEEITTTWRKWTNFIKPDNIQRQLEQIYGVAFSSARPVLFLEDKTFPTLLYGIRRYTSIKHSGISGYRVSCYTSGRRGVTPINMQAWLYSQNKWFLKLFDKRNIMSSYLNWLRYCKSAHRLEESTCRVVTVTTFSI